MEQPIYTELPDEELTDLNDLNEDDGGDEAAELYEHYRVVADKGQQLLRIDKFLLDHLKDTSRHRILLAAKAGFILVARQEQLSSEAARCGHFAFGSSAL